MTMGMLSDDERARVSPARLIDNPTPVPTQVVSSDEFMPVPQTERQKKVEARMNALADEYGKKNGLPRRRFFQTAAGMATAFVAMTRSTAQSMAPRRPRPRASISPRRAPTD
jgi:hypothetical protein